MKDTLIGDYIDRYGWVVPENVLEKCSWDKCIRALETDNKTGFLTALKM